MWVFARSQGHDLEGHRAAQGDLLGLVNQSMPPRAISRADRTRIATPRCTPRCHPPRSDDRPIGLVDRRSRLRPPGSQGGSLRGDPNCLTVNALARRAYTARRRKGDVAMSFGPVLRPVVRPHAGERVTLQCLRPCPSAPVVRPRPSATPCASRSWPPPARP
jgi:hypothetical protein